ncbi:GtrA family protein [Singulisphaera rosea]
MSVSDVKATAPLSLTEDWWSSTAGEKPGLSPAAVAGLQAAKGEHLVVADLEDGYSAEDIARVLDTLDADGTQVVIASRGRSISSKPRLLSVTDWLRRFSKRLLGTSAPFSGLFGVSRALARRTHFSPVGSLFTLEILARTTAPRLDVFVPDYQRRQPRTLTVDDLRHVKRMTDDRFGNFSRLIQFCVVGASGMVVDLTFYAFFQWVLSYTTLADKTTPMVGGPLSLAISGILAIAIALTWNFSLNRRLTFSYAREQSLLRQYVAYALSNALGIGVSLVLRLLLPSHVPYFERHRLAAALVGIVAATGISFSMARWFVFSRQHIGAPSPDNSMANHPSTDQELGDAPTDRDHSSNLSASVRESI